MCKEAIDRPIERMLRIAYVQNAYPEAKQAICLAVGIL